MAEQNPDKQTRSPWSTLRDVHSATILGTNTPVSAALAVPGSKSFTNRALILAALAKGESILSGILRSDDSYWCIEALRTLGLNVNVHKDTVTVSGGGGAWPTEQADLYIGAAGTTARFLPGALAVASQGKWTVDGGKRLRERPLQPLLQALRDLGGRIHSVQETDRLPLIVEGGGLVGGDVHISGNVSSQFLSGLLLAAPYATNPVTIHVTDPIVQHAYVHITLAMMKGFGVSVQYDKELTTLTVEPQYYQGKQTVLEADASTAAYFFAVAAVTQGRVEVTNLNPHSYQPDVKFVNILEQMGCNVDKRSQSIIVEGPAQLKGGFTVSMKELSDQALTLAAIAPFADDTIRVTDVEHIRGHESDRIRVTVENLRRLGIQCEEHRDGFTVHPGMPKAAALPSYDDHRVAMAFAVVGARVNGVEILDPGCVSKTCPNFFDLIRNLGIQVQFHAGEDA